MAEYDTLPRVSSSALAGVHMKPRGQAVGAIHPEGVTVGDLEKPQRSLHVREGGGVVAADPGAVACFQRSEPSEPCALSIVGDSSAGVHLGTEADPRRASIVWDEVLPKLSLSVPGGAVTIATDGALDSTSRLSGSAIALTEDSSPGSIGPTSALVFAQDTVPTSGRSDLMVRGFSGETLNLTEIVCGIMVIENNTTPTVIAAPGVPVKLTVFTTVGEFNIATLSTTGGYIQPNRSRRFQIIATLTTETVAGPGSTITLALCKNGGIPVAGAQAQQGFGAGAGKPMCITLHGFAYLDASDQIELWLTNETDANDLVVRYGQFSLDQRSMEA